MRNLSILRTKTFVACLAKMKVYIEDPSSNELVINGTPCRKLGDIKNGETKVYEIGDEAAKVYVIADKLSKNYCNEFYQLPAGSDDVYLSGKNHYNPANGNAFRFDGNNTEETKANRKKNSRKGLIILAIAVVVGFIIGLLSAIIPLAGAKKDDGDIVYKDKTFTIEGLSITLTDEFKESAVEGFLTSYETPKVLVLVSKDAVADLETPFASAEEYAKYLLELNEMDEELVKNDDGSVYFEYTSDAPEDATEYRHYIYIYKTSDSFWMIQYAIENKDTEELTPEIKKWAETVKLPA